MKTLYEQYAEVDEKIKILEQAKDSIKAEIMSTMIEEGEEKKVTNWGSFTVSMLKKWSYPEAVVAIGEKFKAAKAKAESTGDATYEENPSLRYTAIKI